MAGFVFFDTETTGLDAAFDQIVHFAAIHTDHELRELDRLEVRARLQPHVVPHPKALLTTGLSIAALRDPALPSHYQAIHVIARRLAAWSPAVFVGYNSLGFDEHVLRHGFFQALLDPYLTSRPGNGRADAFALALAGHALEPHCVTPGQRPGGGPSFRLVDIAAANGLLHDKAHDALSDCIATLQLCRLVRDRADNIWQRFQRFASKAAVVQFIEVQDGFVLSEFRGGEAFHHPVAQVGQPADNPNGRFCLDLSRDPDDWAAMSDDELRAELCRKGTPLRRLAVNGAPALTEFWDAPETFLKGQEIETLEARARRLRQNQQLCSRIVDAYTAGWKQRAPSPFPERRLYDGSFPSDADKERMHNFHEASRDERLAIVAAFEDPRLAAFGRRLLHTYHRGSLSQEDRAAADRELAERLMIDRNGPLTLPMALDALDTLAAEAHPDPSQILRGYRVWLIERIARVEAHLVA